MSPARGPTAGVTRPGVVSGRGSGRGGRGERDGGEGGFVTLPVRLTVWAGRQSLSFGFAEVGGFFLPSSFLSSFFLSSSFFCFWPSR